MMRKLMACLLVLGMILSLNASFGEEEKPWNIPESNEMNETVCDLFTKAMETLVGVSYEPVAYLGEKEGVYCVFCRATVVYPGAVPYYALVYITDSGIESIREIGLNAYMEEADETGMSTEAEPETAEGADIQYVLYLGTNDKDTNEPVFDRAEAMEQAKAILIRHFGGYTILEANGGWIDGDTEYQEYTLVIYLSDTTPEQIHAAADEMIEVFHQSSVLIHTNPTETEFYSSGN